MCIRVSRGVWGRRRRGGGVIETDEDFALALLEEKHVALVHGKAFGMSPYVRISYATGDAALEEGCGRIVSFCEEMR